MEEGRATYVTLSSLEEVQDKNVVNKGAEQPWNKKLNAKPLKT